MLILLLTIVLLAACLLFIKYLWKVYEVNKVSFLYGSQNGYGSFEDINKEYYLQIQDRDMDEQVLYDLEVDKVFDIINRTYTNVGREYLYGCFFQENKNGQLLDNMIKLCDNQTLLKKMIYELFSLSKVYDQSLDLFEKIQFLHKKDMILMMLSFMVPFLIVGCMYVYGTGVLMWLFMWFALQSSLYTHYVKKSYGAVSSMMSYCYLIRTLKKLNQLHIFDEEREHNIDAMIQRSLKYTKIYHFCMMIEQVDVYDLFELVKGVFLLPIIQCFLLLKHKNELKNDYLKMFEYVGLIDLAISISSLRQDYQTCVPIINQELQISVKECYHPILKDPVKNSFSTSCSCMITGSNASGKSTFLKTIGFNFLMAKALHMCFADEFIAYPFMLCTSIHMKDDIDKGESYYIKEMKSLKRIVDQVQGQCCLVLIDEILRGTNEKERLIIAKAILSYLWKSGSLVFVTTHDILLVDYFQTIQQYCFNDYVEDNQLYCDYHIRKGVCRVGNAIELLKVYGFHEDILMNIEE